MTMKGGPLANRCGLFLVPAFLVALAVQGNTQAPGMVLSHQKISDTQGGFTGTLDNSDTFGSSAASLGDLDGDGVTDLAVGATFDDDGGPSRGAIWVLFLNPNGTVTAHQKISSTQGGFTGTLDDDDGFGWSVTSLSDHDSDGVSDLAVGAPSDDDGGGNRGAVWVLFLDGTRPMASATMRNGTGVNNVIYSNQTLPILGTNWTTQIDHSGHPGATFTLIIGKSQATSVVIGLGEVLVGGAKIFKQTLPATGSFNIHASFIPNDIQFTGLFVTTQAVILSGTFELGNAIDLCVGF